MKSFKLYIPIFFILSFNILTLLAYVVSPYEWGESNQSLVVIYVLVNYLFIFTGYRLGLRNKNNLKLSHGTILSQITPQIIKFFFLFYTCTVLIKYAYLLRYQFTDIQGMIKHLLIGFYDPRLGYTLSVYDTRPHTISWSMYVVISIINQMFFIFGFANWKNLKKSLKILFLFFLSIEIFYWFGRGTGFGIITLITVFLSSLLVQRKLHTLNIKTILSVCILGVGAVVFFGYLKTERAGGEVKDFQNFNHGSAKINEEHFIFDLLPESQVQTYLHSNSYATQGYYHLGLAMSLDQPFQSTFFLGNNPAAINLANTFGVELWERTYMYKLYVDERIDDKGKWHSGYLWYANDVSLFGVPFILFIISYLLAISYKYVFYVDDLLSKLIFIILFNLLIYLFSNNSFLAYNFYAIMCFIIIWYLTRVQKIKL